MSTIEAGKAMERGLLLRMEAVTYGRAMRCCRCGNMQPKGALMHAHPHPSRRPICDPCFDAQLQKAIDMQKQDAAPVEQTLIAAQVEAWEKEIRRLADLVRAATGGSCAFVKITGTDDGYEDVAPQLILEDALRVNPYGWPQGMHFDVMTDEE